MEMVKRLSGKISRLELDSVKWMEEFPGCAEKMNITGWFSLCERMKGYNLQVTNSFIKKLQRLYCRFENPNFYSG